MYMYTYTYIYQHLCVHAHARPPAHGYICIYMAKINIVDIYSYSYI